MHCRPNDSRMLVALGECYEKLEWLQEAKKCYRKAHNIGDAEGGSLFKLAKWVFSGDSWKRNLLLLMFININIS